MDHKTSTKCVPISKEDLQIAESLHSIIVSATSELERIANRTLQKPASENRGKKKTTVVFTIPAENDRDDVEWDEADGGITCIDHVAKVCCSGPCPCS